MTFVVHCVLVWASVFLPLSVAPSLRSCFGLVTLATLSFGASISILLIQSGPIFATGADSFQFPPPSEVPVYLRTFLRVALSVTLLTLLHIVFQTLLSVVAEFVELPVEDEAGSGGGVVSLLAALASIALWLQLGGLWLLLDSARLLPVFPVEGPLVVKVILAELWSSFAPFAWSLFVFKLLSEGLTAIGLRLNRAPDFTVERASIRIAALILTICFLSSFWTVQNVDSLRQRLLHGVRFHS